MMLGWELHLAHRPEASHLRSLGWLPLICLVVDVHSQISTAIFSWGKLFTKVYESLRIATLVDRKQFYLAWAWVAVWSGQK